MLINKSTYIFGQNVVLVPYKKEHVLKYHEWMQSPELQELTASEPLTLDQEYDMQQTWLNSEDKCTFIVLDRDIYEASKNEIDAMIGDTNLFLQEDGLDKVAEAEVMIAETSARGKHRGWEAMLLMLRYGCDTLSITRYAAKIGMKNIASMKMFQKIGFQEVSSSEVFQEVTLNKNIDEQFISWLKEETKDQKISLL